MSQSQRIQDVFASCFSANKEEVPDNEQEKGTEKEMTERVNEDAEMVRLKASSLNLTLNL